MQAENLAFLAEQDAGVADLIYIDPPFNTGITQVRQNRRMVRDEEHGDRLGFRGKRYRTEELGQTSYGDRFDDYVGFLRPRFEEAHRLLSSDGSFFLHVDPREVHYCKVALDEVFGRRSFLNEIIWAYDYGGRTKKRWPAKHENILWYAKDPSAYHFDYDAMERIPYMAPGLVGKEKAARGKTPTDVWWHTIVSPTSKEKTGYATQKPLGIMERLIKVHSEVGDLVLDFFAGSGTTGVAAAMHGRRTLLVDESPEAIEIAARRMARWHPEVTRPKGGGARAVANGADAGASEDDSPGGSFDAQGVS